MNAQARIRILRSSLCKLKGCLRRESIINGSIGPEWKAFGLSLKELLQAQLKAEQNQRPQ